MAFSDPAVLAVGGSGGTLLHRGVPPSTEAICLWNSMKTRGKKLSAFLPRIFVSVVQGENKCV